MHATHPRTQLDLDPREMPAWLRNKVETKHGEWRLKSRVLGFVAVAREPAGPGGGGTSLGVVLPQWGRRSRECHSLLRAVHAQPTSPTYRKKLGGAGWVCKS